MAKKQKPPRTSAPAPTKPGKSSPNREPAKPLGEMMEQWLGRKKTWVLLLLLLAGAVIRIANFRSVTNGPLFSMYQWNESDQAFFDEWARHLAAGDWLNKEPFHPYHAWHKEEAEYYLAQHPEKMQAILAANPGRDTSFVPGKALWNEWYGGVRYHQEPFYAYVLAVLYALTGKGVWWMLLLQCLIGLASSWLIWQLTRHYFGETAGLVAGLLYLFCGPIVFQETQLLRSSWTVFFSLWTLWLFERALLKKRQQDFLWCGLAIGLAILERSTFWLTIPVFLTIGWMWERGPALPYLKYAGVLLGGVFIALLPLIGRNLATGAPALSTSSVGPVTFVAANLYQTKTVNSWNPNDTLIPQVMGATGGRMRPAAIAALRTHPSPATYFSLLKSKLENSLGGLEWPSNENFYFYRSIVPVLQWLPVTFYWIVSLGFAGMLMSFYFRRRSGALAAMALVQLLILAGFYVVGRLRLPLLALLIPFAAYAVVECFRFSRQEWKISLGKLALTALSIYFLSVRYWRPDSLMLRKLDYNVLYEIYYLPKIIQHANAKEWSQALKFHNEFMEYEPDIVKKANLKTQINYNSDIDMVAYFARQSQIRSDLLRENGSPAQAEAEMRRAELLYKVAEQSRAAKQQ